MNLVANPSWCSQTAELLFQEVLASNVTFSNVLLAHSQEAIAIPRVLGQKATNYIEFEKLNQSFMELFMNERINESDDNTDLILQLPDGKLHVHKTIFCKVSSYFKSMLGHSCKEQCSNVVNLKDVDLLPMMLTVQYIYIGSACLTDETVLDVMALADYFNIPSLFRLCSYYAQRNICARSCVSVHTAAVSYNDRDLARYAMSYAARHAHLLLADVDNCLLHAPPACLQQLFSHPLLIRDERVSHFKIIEAVKAWADHDPSVRYSYITTILSVPELCCLLHHHPRLAGVLTLHPDSNLPLNSFHSFDNARLQQEIETIEVLFVVGGEECGRLCKSVECYNTANPKSPRDNKWSFMYSICDRENSLPQRNVECELAKLRFYSPISLETVNKMEKNTKSSPDCHSLNMINSTWFHEPENINVLVDSEPKSFNVKDPDLSKLLDSSYNSYVGLLRDMASSKRPASRLSSRHVVKRTIATIEARQYAAVVTLEASNTMVVIGGLDDCRSASACVSQFWPDDNSWSQLPLLPSALYGCSAAVINDDIYCAGGANCIGFSNSFSRLPYNSASWEVLPPVPLVKGPCYAAAAVINGCFVLLGGLVRSGALTSFSSSCWRYDPATRRWRRMASLPVRCAYHCAAVLGQQLYVMGGYDGTRWLNSVHRYNQHTDSWTQVQGMLTPRSSFAVSVSEGSMHVMGGFNGHRPTNETGLGKLAHASQHAGAQGGRWGGHATSLVLGQEG
ncbi:kelch-like protein 10 isoform X2 [Hyalella azteca]|uniref:Kelch-like protein 10 isoform X2 n=1 Tax=Hyalella azteca TaxID=294128 RepID=A0A979FH50_HYAAZ|nr:kelch-like protein 10 isoform X2 [Hyalella azteca]